MKNELEQSIEKRCVQMQKEIETSLTTKTQDEVRTQLEGKITSQEPVEGVQKQFWKWESKKEMDATNEPNLQKIIKEELEEYKERLNRSNNIVITGMDEDLEESSQTIEKWITKNLRLEPNEIKVQEIRRLGGVGKSNRLILIKLQNKQQQKITLTNSKHLKEQNLSARSKIYINPDLTKQQQFESFQKRQNWRNTNNKATATTTKENMESKDQEEIKDPDEDSTTGKR